MPVVSVIMPVYNGERFLREAVESVLVQTLRDFELIIINDGSVDSSKNILEEYQKDERVVLVHQHNQGLAASLNLGLSMARSDLIARMDADDVCFPDRLELQYNYMINHPDVDVLGGGVCVIDQDGQVLDFILYPETDLMNHWAMNFYNPLVHPSVMFRKNVLESVGGYRDLRSARQECFPEDYDLWVRLSPQAEFGNLAKYILKLRKHSFNVTNIYASSTLDHSVLISATYINRVLVENNEIEVVRTLLNLPGEDLFADAAKLLERLSLYFLNKKNISRSEGDFIRRDVAERLTIFALKSKKLSLMLRLIIKAVRFSFVSSALLIAGRFVSTIHSILKKRVAGWS